MFRQGILYGITAENSKACWLLLQVEPAVHKYVASQNMTADHTRHGTRGTRKRYRLRQMQQAGTTHNAGSDSMKDATTLSSPEGNGSSKHNPDGTLRMQHCVIGYCPFFPQMGSRKQNIKHGPVPAQSYNTKSAIHALKEFRQQLLSLTQRVQALFETLLPDEHST